MEQHVLASMAGKGNGSSINLQGHGRFRAMEGALHTMFCFHRYLTVFCQRLYSVIVQQR